MSAFQINDDEREALRGLPPLVQSLYLLGLRPYMDFHTGLVGVMRGISWYSLCEELEVWTEQGFRGEKRTKGQLERALNRLVKRGLVEWDRSTNERSGRLVLRLKLCKQDTCALKNPIRPPYDQNDKPNTEVNQEKYININENRAKQGGCQDDHLVIDPPNPIPHPGVRDKSQKQNPLTPLVPVPLPDWLDSQLWGAFTEHRASMKAPLSRQAECLAIAQLERLQAAGEDPKAVIEQTILRGWKTFYAVKGDDHGQLHTNGNRLSPVERIWQANKHLFDLPGGEALEGEWDNPSTHGVALGANGSHLRH